MKKIERITKRIKEDKNLLKNIDDAFFGVIDDKIGYFIEHVESYIKAIKENRMFCVIQHVSGSGMTRWLSFASCERGQKRYWFRNYFSLFNCLGYSYNEKWDAFKVEGCGMDMIFATNYNNFYDFVRLGFVTEKQAESLRQNTPTTF